MSQNPGFLRHLYALTLIGSAALSITHPVWAGPKDGEAKKLAESAIYEDYLNLQFDAALEKLNQANTLCEEGCGQSVKATILRDLGVVHFAGKEDRTKALEYFKQAFQADPFIQLDEDLSSDEIKAVFDEARQAVGAPSSASDSSDSDEPAKPAAAAGAHTAPKEQAVDTPVPLYMTAPDDTDAVKLMFKTPGQDKFRSMGLRRYKAGWGGEVDCNAISKTPGTMEYYFIMYDELGREAGRVGDEFDAFSLPIKSSISGPGPALPDQGPPGSCKEVMAADCPPGFPGCETYEKEQWAQEEEVEEGEKPTVWLTLSASADFLLVPASNTACTTASPYSCYYGDTFRDPNRDLQNPNGTQVADSAGRTVPQQAGNPRDPGFEGSGSIPGGLTLATQRILIGVDYAVMPELLVGLRLGYAIGGGPTEGPTGAAFLPFHAEGRVAYWFGGAHKGVFRPFIQVGGGAAQVDAKVEVQIVDPAFVPKCAADRRTAGEGCLVQTVNAWRKAGTVFGTAGLGAMIPTGETAGFVVEGRAMLLFPDPTAGTAISGLLGFTIGL